MVEDHPSVVVQPHEDGLIRCGLALQEPGHCEYGWVVLRYAAVTGKGVGRDLQPARYHRLEVASGKEEASRQNTG